MSIELYFRWKVAILAWNGEERVWVRQNPETFQWEEC
jgi:hypothetical protein